MTNNPIYNKINSIILSDIKVKGYVGELIERFFHSRITSEYAKNVIYKEAEDAFKNKIDDAEVYGIWQGEFWGKLMISASRACKYLGNEELKDFLKKAAYQLLEYQEDNGYIGTYRNSLNVFQCDAKEARKVIGWDCNWNWNIWCRKYTLWGLLELYMLLDDTCILKGAERLASHLIDELHFNNISISDTGTFKGMPSCSILKPIVILYRLTDNSKYLDFALEIANSWENESGKAPNLITNAFSGKPIHEWYPNSEQWAKAYEMMSCLDGLLELYRVTGTKKYIEAVQIIHELLYKYEKNIMLSVGFNDIFAVASEKLNVLSEPCDVIHWCRITYELYCLTGESKYMDIFEYAFYNAFLAGVSSDGKWGARAVRSSHRHFIAEAQANFTYNHCCVDNMPRCFLNMAEAAVMRGENGIYVNLFTPIDVMVNFDNNEMVNVNISGDYLQSGWVTIEAESNLRVATDLYIRIPEWSKSTIINTEDVKQNVNVTGYYKLCLKPSAKSVIDIRFDLNPRIMDFPFEPVVYLPEEWQSARWAISDDKRYGVSYKNMIRGPKSTVMVGPILLSRSKHISNTEVEMFSDKSIFGGNYICKITKIATPAEFQCMFEVEFISREDTIKTIMCDYASSCKERNTDEYFFNIYV